MALVLAVVLKLPKGSLLLFVLFATGIVGADAAYKSPSISTTEPRFVAPVVDDLFVAIFAVPAEKPKGSDDAVVVVTEPKLAPPPKSSAQFVVEVVLDEGALLVVFVTGALLPNANGSTTGAGTGATTGAELVLFPDVLVP